MTHVNVAPNFSRGQLAAITASAALADGTDPSALRGLGAAKALAAAPPGDAETWRAVMDLARAAKALVADRRFMTLHAAYRAHGGMLRGAELNCRWRNERADTAAPLEALIVSGLIFSFQWQDDWWVPMFQFEPRSLRVDGAACQVLAELYGVLDGWELAEWFVQRHLLLRWRRPLDLLYVDLPAVQDAARAHGRIESWRVQAMSGLQGSEP